MSRRRSKSRFEKATALPAAVQAATTDIASSAWSTDVMTAIQADHMSTARPYAQVNVVQAAIQAMRRNAAKTVMQVGKYDEEGGFTPIEHPLCYLWQRPGPGENDITLIEFIYENLLEYGNAYVQLIPNKAGNAIAEIMAIPYYWIQPPVMGESLMEVILYRVIGTDWGRQYNFETPGEMMMHFRTGRSKYRRIEGVSVLDSVVAELALLKILAQYETTILQRSGVPSWIVSVKNAVPLNRDQVDQMQGDLKRSMQGKAVGRPFVTNGEVDIKSPGFSPEQLSVASMADLATARVCGVLGWAPMSLKQPDTGKTYSNLIEANKASWRDAVIPFLDMIAGQLTRIVQTMSVTFDGETSQPDEELVVRFDTSQIEELAIDKKSVMDRVVAGVNAGIMTVDEARADLELGPMTEAQKQEMQEGETETEEKSSSVPNPVTLGDLFSIILQANEKHRRIGEGN